MTGHRVPILFSGVLVAACAFSGCASFFSQPENVEVTRTEVTELRREQRAVLSLLEELKAQTEDQSESVATLRADTNFNRDEMNQKLDVLRSMIEDLGVQFERFQREVDERVQRSGSSDPSATTGYSRGGGLDPPATGTPPAAGSPPASANQIYDAAFRDFSRGNYPLALTGFRELLRYYPEMDLSDNAQYWTGECHYALGELDQAVAEYLKVRDLYPDGDKVAAATLKAGYAFLRKGDGATARRYFETVIREFPNSDEASLAQDKLKEPR